MSSTAGYKAWAVEGHRTVGLFAPGRAVNPIRFGKIAILPILPSPWTMVFENARDFNMMQERADLTGAQVGAFFDSPSQSSESGIARSQVVSWARENGNDFMR